MLIIAQVVDCFISSVWWDEEKETIMAELSCPMCDAAFDSPVDCNRVKYVKCNVCLQLCRVWV
jgi:hypothetical protein